MSAHPDVLGVDGCPGGWVSARVGGDGTVRWDRLTSALELLGLLAERPAAVVGIDIPLGLPEAGEGRECDRQARAALGARGSSVFSAPVRAVLGASDYRDACARSRAASGRALSLQSWHLCPRIAQVDALWDRIPPGTDVVEVHPELAFTAITGAPLASKHTSAGREARREALGGPDLAGRPRGVPVIDCLDALAAAWSAARVRDGHSRLLPDGPAPRDARGRPMQVAV